MQGVWGINTNLDRGNQSCMHKHSNLMLKRAKQSQSKIKGCTITSGYFLTFCVSSTDFTLNTFSVYKIYIYIYIKYICTFIPPHRIICVIACCPYILQHQCEGKKKKAQDSPHVWKLLHILSQWLMTRFSDKIQITSAISQNSFI